MVLCLTELQFCCFLCADPWAASEQGWQLKSDFLPQTLDVVFRVFPRSIRCCLMWSYLNGCFLFCFFVLPHKHNTSFLCVCIVFGLSHKQVFCFFIWCSSSPQTFHQYVLLLEAVMVPSHTSNISCCLKTHRIGSTEVKPQTFSNDHGNSFFFFGKNGTFCLVFLRWVGPMT